MHILNVSVGRVSITCEQKIGACRPCISWKSLASKWPADAAYFASKWPDDATYFGDKMKKKRHSKGRIFASQVNAYFFCLLYVDDPYGSDVQLWLNLINPVLCGWQFLWRCIQDFVISLSLCLFVHLCCTRISANFGCVFPSACLAQIRLYSP